MDSIGSNQNRRQGKIGKAFGKDKNTVKELNKSIAESRKGFLSVEKILVPTQFLFLLVFKIGICVIILSSLIRYFSGNMEATKAIILIVMSFVVFSGFELAGSMQSIKGVAVQNLNSVINLRNLPVIEEGKKTEVDKAEISMENISFSYNEKRKILKNINLSVEKGEMISIVGSNGAGKSTLSKVIAGFERQDEGKIYYKNLDISNESIAKRAEKIGFVLQNPNAMISKVTVFEEVALGLKTRGVSEDEIEKRVLEILEICKLKPFRKWPIKALSYGQKKRVTIASVLVLEPEIIIVDEPTAGQDIFHYREIMEFLKRLNEYGITILFITHDMHLMLEYTDKAYVFNDGQIIKSGNPAQILADKKVLEQANLRETSLHYVAEKIEINPEELISTFVYYEKNCEKEQKKAGD